MVKWFDALGLDFENDHRVTFTENIGWGVYSCTKKDCTQDMIKAVRSTFDIYMAEKGEASSAHYNSIMNKYFNEVGIGIALRPDLKKYFLTIHYATKITSALPPVCP